MKTLLALMLALSFSAFAGENLGSSCEDQFSGVSSKDATIEIATESTSSSTTRQ